MEQIPYYCRMERQKLNAITIENELQWLKQIIDFRFNAYFSNESEYTSVLEIESPTLENDESVYAGFLKVHKLDFQSRLILILALAPHIRPQVLDSFFLRNNDLNRGYTEFGGLKGENHSGFIPTGETATFLYAGLEIEKRMQVIKVFDSEHIFYKKKIILLDLTKESEPFLSGALVISSDFIDLFTLGKSKKPKFSAKFPATKVETSLTWDDLILDPASEKSVNHMLTWIKNDEKILQEWGMKSKIKPGYRALFYGPPGTGKTLTASLLGEATGKEVYKIDISMISSKWVGETEKNLARIFDAAEDKNWILFFDEADSIFGKRTSNGSSQEKHSNQEVSYLLQRTEEYPGVVILASNLKGNIDEAFIRRFQSMVYFNMPDFEERFKLWKNAFNDKLTLAENVDLKQISKDYELAGGAIINILKFCSIRAVQKETHVIAKNDIIEGIRYELAKEGKIS